MEKKLSDEYLKGWVDGKKEAKEIMNKKYNKELDIKSIFHKSLFQNRLFWIFLLAVTLFAVSLITLFLLGCGK